MLERTETSKSSFRIGPDGILVANEAIASGWFVTLFEKGIEAVLDRQDTPARRDSFEYLLVVVALDAEENPGIGPG